jgi:hypothetical protein
VVVEKFSAPKWRFARKFQSVPGVVEATDVKAAIDRDRAFAEWWATSDCDAPRREQLTGPPRSWFGKWLESLCCTPGSRPSEFPEAATGEAGDRSQAVSG